MVVVLWATRLVARPIPPSFVCRAYTHVMHCNRLCPVSVWMLHLVPWQQVNSRFSTLVRLTERYTAGACVLCCAAG